MKCFISIISILSKKNGTKGMLTSPKRRALFKRSTLSIVKDIFEGMKIHHLLVVEVKKVFGVVSDRDLYKALSPNIGKITETPKDAATLNKQVYHIVTRRPVVLTPTATIAEVINIFNANNFSCIPIADHEMKPVGIITIRDIIKTLADGNLMYNFHTENC